MRLTEAATRRGLRDFTPQALSNTAWAFATAAHAALYVHTCTGELHLPPYASAEQLRERLLLALEHRGDGFQNE